MVLVVLSASQPVHNLSVYWVIHASTGSWPRPDGIQSAPLARRLPGISGASPPRTFVPPFRPLRQQRPPHRAISRGRHLRPESCAPLAAWPPSSAQPTLPHTASDLLAPSPLSLRRCPCRLRPPHRSRRAPHRFQTHCTFGPRAHSLASGGCNDLAAASPIYQCDAQPIVCADRIPHFSPLAPLSPSLSPLPPLYPCRFLPAGPNPRAPGRPPCSATRAQRHNPYVVMLK